MTAEGLCEIGRSGPAWALLLRTGLLSGISSCRWRKDRLGDMFAGITIIFQFFFTMIDLSAKSMSDT